LIVVLPLARWFETRKQLTPIEELARSATASCAECGRMFNVADMITHNSLYVCAQCKPVFLQKLTEGADVLSRKRRPAERFWVILLLIAIAAVLCALILPML
jgi:hypothetical protein